MDPASGAGFRGVLYPGGKKDVENSVKFTKFLFYFIFDMLRAHFVHFVLNFLKTSV